MKHVVLLTGNALCNNPRAQKEAAALTEAGMRVTILGAWVSAHLRKRDLRLLDGKRYTFKSVTDFSERAQRAFGPMVLARARTALGRKVHAAFGIESRWQLGYAVDALLRHALAMEADLYIAHSEAGLYAARELRHRNLRIGVDMEDWFSEDISPEARRGRPLHLLRNLEREVLLSASHASCPSAAMAHALSAVYGCRTPAVIYNAFPWSEREHLDGLRKDRTSDASPSIHWYSQTLGPERGLEELVASLPQLELGAQVHLRGDAAPGYRAHLLDRLPAAHRGRLRFHAPVDNEELLSRIAEHDIGYSGELPHIRSRDLSLTNKICHYLLAGIPAVARDTRGNREAAERAPGAVQLWPAADTVPLASLLNRLVADRDRLGRARAAALSAASTTFCWERCAPALVASVEGAFVDGPRGASPVAMAEAGS